MFNTTEGLDIIKKLSDDKLFGIHTNSIYSFIGVLSMFGNGLVIYVFVQAKSLRKGVANIFILNQSCIDGLTGAVLLANCQSSEIPAWMLKLNGSNKWIFEVYCRLWLSKVILWGLLVSSTYNILIVTMERYLSIIYPILHRQHMNKKKVFLSIKIIWIFGLGFNFAYMIPTSKTNGDRCILYQAFPSHWVQTSVGCLVLIIQYFLPLIIIAYCYICIFLKISVSDKMSRSNVESMMIRVRRNVIRTLLMISACFIIFWTPNQLLYAMYNMGVSDLFTNKFFHISVCMVYLNSCCNPLIYALSYESFKKAAKKVFCGKKSIHVDLTSSNSNPYIIST